MKNSIFTPTRLLRDRDAFWSELRDNALSWGTILRFIAFIVVACAVYGAVLAGWRSPRLALYGAIKLPLLFLATVALVSIFNWMLASLMAAGLEFKITIFVVCAAMTITSWILLSLAPVAFFFVLSGVPATGSEDQLHYAHNCILVTHITILAIAGVAGYSALFRGLKRLVKPQCPAGLLFLAWLTSSAFVGCQMAWILRPFVGSPFYPVAFMRPDCLKRNFYEFVVGEVLPYIVKGEN